ncbi:hypothetical protein GVAV_002407 [Gurleya vavrai]
MIFLELFIIAIFIYALVRHKASQNNNSEGNIENENFRENDFLNNQTILENNAILERISFWKFNLENLDAFTSDIFLDFFKVLNKNHKFLDKHKEEFDSICKNKKFSTFDRSNLFSGMKIIYCLYDKKRITKNILKDSTRKKTGFSKNLTKNEIKEYRILVINCLEIIKKFCYNDLFCHEIDCCKNINSYVENEEIYKKICQYAFLEIFISDEEAILTCIRYLHESIYQ